MDKYKKYYGVLTFLGIIILSLVLTYVVVKPKFEAYISADTTIETKQSELTSLQGQVTNVKNKIQRMNNSIINAQKKIYSPVESDLGTDTLFFTLYNDIIEMIHSNSVKIKSMEYVYNPEEDNFVSHGKDKYFVCELNFELVSNYINLGKLIEDIYQYPYYTKIQSLEIKPYEKDKKILITNLVLRMYAHTSPDNEVGVGLEMEENN